MTTTLNFIDINERAYKYIRQFTIKGIDDALIELITNSIDAYNKTSLLERKIDIIIKNPDTLIVKDYAIGLTASELQKCFLQAGNYTASDTSRGFFSRGAKDISAIGNVYFTGFKNGFISQCLLNTDAYGGLTIENEPLTNEIRNLYNMPEPYNGLCVELKLLPNYQNINITQLKNTIVKIATLREIFANPKNIINLYNGDTLVSRLSYTYPSGQTILDLEYKVPNYQNYTARFVIKQSDIPIAQPIKENQMEFGFLMRDSTSVYEVNTLNSRFRWNPYMNYIYGYIYSDGIHDLLLDYDNNGTSESNPYPIIDPARITGLNHQHPFIVNLLSIPLVRIDYILRQMNISKTMNEISIDELNDILSEIDNLGDDIISDTNLNVKWENNYDQNLAKAIEDDRANYVNYEKAYDLGSIYDTEEIEIRNYIKDEIIKQNPEYDFNHIYIQDESKNIIQLPNIKYSDIENDPINILSLLETELTETLKKHPYIYRLADTDHVEKIYIFDKGTFNYTSENPNIKIRSKNFKISFINDLNLQERYIIDTTEGINIKINLNNPVVKKNLSNENTAEENIDVTNIKSQKALFFMKELLIDVFSNIILTSDTISKKISFDSDDYNNVRKMIEHKNKVVGQIEIKIDKIFQNYISKATNSNLSNISDIINQIGASVMSKITDNTDTSDIVLLKDQLIKVVELAVTK